MSFLMPRGFFVTGTDTEVGKTHATVRLMRFLKSQGLSVIGMKPVASGARKVGERWVNEDALALQRESSVPIDYQYINPFVFERPVSPHIAAEAMGVRVNLDRISQAFCHLSTLADCVVVEGVGGWRVPLNADEDVADLALRLSLPVLQVVGIRLGCINHARLTQESMIASEVNLGGWIANWLVPDLPYAAEVMASLDHELGRKALAELAFQTVEIVQPSLDEDCWRGDEILRLMAA